MYAHLERSTGFHHASDLFKKRVPLRKSKINIAMEKRLGTNLVFRHTEGNPFHVAIIPKKEARLE
jgi:hypothetical protein